mmetsp:Transcript_57975/g.84806  ORF Transcript_57975/g.84806 Transcript_57975/m.84806 type:complete len:98 (-) Transcript_57975:302-595(-)
MNRHQSRTHRPLNPEAAEWVPSPIFVSVEFVCEKSQVGDAELHKVEAGADFAAVLLVAKEKISNKGRFDFDQAEVKIKNKSTKHVVNEENKPARSGW